MDSRALAMGTIDYIVGPIEEMEEDTIRTLETLRRVLELPALRVARAQDEEAEQAAAERLGLRSAIEAA
jgi:PleD family two-component response regulator